VPFGPDDWWCSASPAPWGAGSRAGQAQEQFAALGLIASARAAGRAAGGVSGPEPVLGAYGAFIRGVIVKDFPTAKDLLRSDAEKFTEPENHT
jgi:hypothetical protein